MAGINESSACEQNRALRYIKIARINLALHEL